MKTEKEIREKIAKVTKDNKDVLDCRLATIDINAPRALMQLHAKCVLAALYWIVDEKRPMFKCDER